MYIKALFIAIALLSNIVNYSSAQTVGRAFASCGYLSKKGIYCFGGATTSASSTSLPATNIYFLDLAKNNGSTAKELATKWTNIESNKNNVLIQAMDYPQDAVLGDGSTMLINGGQNYGGMTAASKTVGYNADNNSWIAYPDFVQPPFAARQIFRGTSIYVPGYGVAFYGGREANRDPNWTIDGQNVTAYDATSVAGARYIGYVKLTFFDIRRSDPWYEYPIQTNMPTLYGESQQAVFDSANNKILFLGGGSFNPVSRAFSYPSTIKNALIFDLGSGAWSTSGLGGAAVPTNRVLFTLTLLTSTGRDVILYGGQGVSTYSLDYLYTLNLDTYQWTKQQLPTDVATDLIRSGHSAVLLNETLLIMFGRNQLDQMLSSMIMLNVKDPYQITFLDTYIDPNAPLNTTNTPGLDNKTNPESGTGNNTETFLDSSSGLSTGATAGIAVGATIAGIAIILAIVLFFWKRNKNKKSREAEIPEMADVNWDEIEKNYTEDTSNLPKNDSNRTYELANNNTAIANNQTDANKVSIRPDITNITVRPDSEANHLFEKPDGGK